MRKSTVLAYYNDDAQKVADTLNISRAAVYMWKGLVPKVRAYELEKLTGGALKVDPSLYPAKPRKTPESIVA